MCMKYDGDWWNGRGGGGSEECNKMIVAFALDMK